MHVRTKVIRGTARAGRVPDLSAAARLRLKWMDYYAGCGRNAALTCRHFGISRQTFYQWRRRYDPQRVATLEDRARRPRRTRQPAWPPQLAQAVLALREAHPRWGKDKLALLLQERGWQVSTSMVGRILTQLRQRGVLREPLANCISIRKRLLARPYAVRKPKDYQPRQPGDLVQIDTLDVRPLPGVVLKHFTARDVVSRWDVVAVYSRATAGAARQFLDQGLARMPFPVRAIQVDGGSEFQAAFEEACQERGLRLFVLPPRSPKLNGCVERAQRTHTEEFYELYDGDFHLVPLNRALRAWERVYNTLRPHQALRYLTPHKYLLQCAA
jgi:transposase InsO family protein